MLQHRVEPGEVAYEEVMAMLYQVAVHKGSGGLGHGEGGRLFIPDILREGEKYSLNDWLEINLGSGINNGS